MRFIAVAYGPLENSLFHVHFPSAPPLAGVPGLPAAHGAVEFPTVPTAVWVLGSIALVTALNLVGIESITRVNWVLIVAQLVFIVVFVALSIHNLSGQAEPVPLLKPFYHEGFSVPLIMTGAAVLCLSFLGFDAVSTMAEETPDPRRTIPQAIMAVSLIGGLLFLVVSYCAQMVFPEWNSFADPAGGGSRRSRKTRPEGRAGGVQRLDRTERQPGLG